MVNPLETVELKIGEITTTDYVQKSKSKCIILKLPLNEINSPFSKGFTKL